MWWPWRSATPLYLARGVILLERRSHSAATQAVHCEPGREIEQLAAIVRGGQTGRFQVFADPSFVSLRSMPRVAGVWRQAERDRAAKGLANIDAKDFVIATVDPAPDSAWIVNSCSSATLLALREPNSAVAGRLRGLVSYAGYLLSSLLSRRRAIGLIALTENGDLTWAVGDRNRVVAAGTVNGLPSEEARGECARLALAHGLSQEAIRILQLRRPRHGAEEAAKRLTKPACGLSASLPFRELLDDLSGAP